MNVLWLVLLVGAAATSVASDSHVSSNSDEDSDLPESSKLSDELPSSRVSCTACVSAVGLLQTLLETNATYEELVNASIAVCYQLVPSEGWDPDTLCDLAIDTYAPHVIYIMNATDKNAREICTLVNNCAAVSPSTLSSRPPGVAPSSADRVRSSGDVNVKGRRRTPAEWKADDYEGTLRLVHLSDIHTDYLYAEGSAPTCQMPLCCRDEYIGTGSARHWGEYQCNIPHRTVDLILSDIAARVRPQLVAVTGDTVQHTVWDQPLDQTIEVDRYITERLANYFPDSAIYFTLGNHDICPTNLYYADRVDIKILNEAMFDHWKPLSGYGDDQWLTYERGAYYTIDYRAGLRIVSYNSNYGTTENFYNILNVDEPDYAIMKQFLEDTLAAARQNGEKVILLGHHPTGSGGYLIDYSYFITDLQARYSDVIVLHLMGHSHSDTFTIVRDFTTGDARGVQLSSPSMTSYTDKNPSYRVIYLDPDTFEPLDMDTYHLNLTKQDGEQEPQIEFVYRMTDEYAMTDMSPASFQDFANRMSVDRDLMEKYRYNVETRVFVPSPCDDNCAARLLCRMENTDYERLQQCYNSIGNE